MGLSGTCDSGLGPGSGPGPASEPSIASPSTAASAPGHPELPATVSTAVTAAIHTTADAHQAGLAMAKEARPRNIVIIGGGVIGCTTAYYLTRHPSFNPDIHRVTLLEASSIAAAASGKAGGLLARWAYPQCMVGLSFDLHRELADQHGGAEKWGYRRLECGQLSAIVPKYHVLEKSRRTKRKSSEVTGEGPGAGPSSATNPPQETGTLQSAPIPETAPNQDNSNTPREGLISREQVSTSDKDLQANTTGQEAESAAKTNNCPGASSPHTPAPAPPQETEGLEWQKVPKQEKRVKESFRKSKLPQDLDWIESKFVQEYDEMGLEGFNETAQVHPYQFTHAMAEMARAGGTDIRTNAKVTHIDVDEAQKSVTGITYVDRLSNKEHRLQNVTDVVLAAGPWTGRLLPRTSIEGLRQHSVVYNASVSPYAVFTFISLPSTWTPPHRIARGERRRHRGRVDPELYSRPNGEVYACGEPDSQVPLPETADLVEVDEPHCDDLIAYIGTMSPVLRAAPVATKQACYLPQHVRKPSQNPDPDGEPEPAGGAPLVGATSVSGLWVAAGHSCWGVHNSPATGKLISEFVFEGAAKSADIEPLDPRKFKV